MPWSLRYTQFARRQLRRLSNSDQKIIKQAVDKMVRDPGSADLTKLSGRKNEWRLRIGTWRVIFWFENNTGTMWVLKILPRREAYRD